MVGIQPYKKLLPFKITFINELYIFQFTIKKK